MGHALPLLHHWVHGVVQAWLVPFDVPILSGFVWVSSPDCLVMVAAQVVFQLAGAVTALLLAV